MPSRKLVPPPEKATWLDAVRFVYGGLFILLGIAILVRAISEGIITPPAILMGMILIAFGVYRLYVGIVRYRMFRAAQSRAMDNQPPSKGRR